MPRATKHDASRRSFLLTSGSVAAAVALPAAALASIPDHPIVDLERAFTAAHARYRADAHVYSQAQEAHFAWKRGSEPSGDQREWQDGAAQVMQSAGFGEAEERHSQSTTDLTDILDQVAATPAHRLEGLIAKARMWAGDDEVAVSIVADLLTMDKRGAV